MSHNQRPTTNGNIALDMDIPTLVNELVKIDDDSMMECVFTALMFMEQNMQLKNLTITPEKVMYNIERRVEYGDLVHRPN